MKRFQYYRPEILNVTAVMGIDRSVMALVRTRKGLRREWYTGRA